LPNIPREQIRPQFLRVIAAKRNVVAAQYNFRLWPGTANIFYHFFETIVPVGHRRLDHNKIERPFFGQKTGEQITRQTEPPEVAGDCF